MASDIRLRCVQTRATVYIERMIYSLGRHQFGMMTLVKEVGIQVDTARGK